LAEHLDYVYLDTGVMYRAVTWAALVQGIALQDETEITCLAKRLTIDVERPSSDDGRQYTVLAGGRDVTWAIRAPEVDRGVSPVSAYPGVRQALTEQQRRVGRRGRIVMVGRDIGTVVLPDADLKIYLDATQQERIQRRYREVLEREGCTDIDVVSESVRVRDEIDSSRELAPLKPASDAIVIDTTPLDVEQVMARVIALVDGWRAEDGDSRPGSL
jgi:cytidylate kinase